MQAILTKVLNKNSPKKVNRISYYEAMPLAQIHIDTMFYELTTEKKHIPILIICDVATRYLQAYIQTSKNDNILQYALEFVDEVRSKFPTSIQDNRQVLFISHGAPELTVLKKKFRHKVSVSINKAAIAEAAIKRIRYKFRKLETYIAIENITENKHTKIDKEFIIKNLPDIIIDLNSTAKITKIEETELVPKYELGQLVFVKSIEKFEGDKIGKKLSKKSYLLNYDPEPMMINNIILYNNSVKYEVMSLFNFESMKYYYYEEELQLIPSKIALDYIENYNKHYEKFKNSKNTTNALNWKNIKNKTSK